MMRAITKGSQMAVVSEAYGRALEEDITAPVSHPMFDQSAVDGYGIRYGDLSGKKSFKVVGEIKAGDRGRMKIGEHEAVSIFTGSPVPDTVDAIVMKEDVKVAGQSIIISKNNIHQGANIRRKGEQISKGDVAMEGGALLTAASLGFLASLGIPVARVYKLPAVGMIITGNEIISSKEDLQEGKIFESNGIMLSNSLKLLGLKADAAWCRDNLNALKKGIRSAETKYDTIITTGGVSVGKYDFVRNALEQLGYTIHIHGVAQKPGKPFLFAQKEKVSVFGLPGNPLSAMVCYYEYVYPFLRACMGCRNPFMREVKLPLSAAYAKKHDGKTHFLAGKIKDGSALILEKQHSHMLQSMAKADVIIQMPDNRTRFRKGDAVCAQLLPEAR